MKTKIRKIIYTAAAALFIGGLAINIYMTLDDPFKNVSSLALAEKTGSDNSTQDCDGKFCKKEVYHYKSGFRVTYVSGSVRTALDISLGDFISGQKLAEAKLEGEIKTEEKDSYKSDCVGTEEPQGIECISMPEWQFCPSFGCPGQDEGSGGTT